LCRTIYRFVGKEEYDSVIRAKYATLTDEKLGYMHTILVKQMDNFMSQQDVGNLIQAHTMSESGGGSIGGGQALVSATLDVDQLSRSTDDAVQKIVQNADFILEFKVPRGAVLEAPSELSQKEREVLVPNDIEALPACFVKAYPNKFKKV